MENVNNLIKGLYIHIPFCDHICAYCDFKKMIAKDDLKVAYVNALLKEIEYRKDLLGNVQTIYIGGGTPSSLTFDLLKSIFNKLKECIDLSKIIEFTMEANPKDINNDNIDDWISLFKTYHINRLSLGVQSFNNKKLKTLGRNHQKIDAINTIRLLHQNNFDNINCDLIFGLSGDNYHLIKKDIKTCIKNNIKHISLYSLILEEHTLFYNMYKDGKAIELDSDNEAKIYYKITKYLKGHNILPYEISNFSYPGYESKHNLLTWNNEHYLGIGVSASSYVEGVRFTNIKSVKTYIKKIEENDYKSLTEEENTLSLDDMIYEHLILGLRKIKGINLNDFKNRFNVDLLDYYPNINKLIKDDVLEIKDGNLAIKCDKIYLENAVIEKITN